MGGRRRRGLKAAAAAAAAAARLARACRREAKETKDEETWLFSLYKALGEQNESLCNKKPLLAMDNVAFVLFHGR